MLFPNSQKVNFVSFSRRPFTCELADDFDNDDVFGHKLLAYFRKKSKSWDLIKHNYGAKSLDTANNAVNNIVYDLGGASKARLVKFGSSGINWTDNPFWETEKDAEWAWALHRQPFWLSLAWVCSNIFRSTRELLFPCSGIPVHRR